MGQQKMAHCNQPQKIKLNNKIKKKRKKEKSWQPPSS
jgi:hypothetical protein